VTPEERATWDVDPDRWPHTPPLHVFRELMDEDDNWWWQAGAGHGLNAYEAAVEALEAAEAAVGVLTGEVVTLRAQIGHLSGCAACGRDRPCNGPHDCAMVP
jgi:hypothetical protein